jgi:hypothetical protein
LSQQKTAGAAAPLVGAWKKKIAVTERQALNPCMPSITMKGSTPVAEAVAAVAPMREQTAIPVRIKQPDTMLSAKHTWPMPRIAPAKKSLAAIPEKSAVDACSGRAGITIGSQVTLPMLAEARRHMKQATLNGNVKGGNLQGTRSFTSIAKSTEEKLEKMTVASITAKLNLELSSPTSASKVPSASPRIVSVGKKKKKKLLPSL